MPAILTFVRALTVLVLVACLGGPTGAGAIDLDPGSLGGQATFRLCGSSDPATDRAIEQLIAGRSFSATLSARGDGCADLTLSVSGGVSGGSEISTLSVGSGDRTISVQIATQNGVTRASTGG